MIVMLTLWPWATKQVVATPQATGRVPLSDYDALSMGKLFASD
jgi:hypothetical protein